MAFLRKVVIAVDLNEPLSETMREIKSMDMLKNSEIHFITVHQTSNYAIGLGDSAIIYPVESDDSKIQNQSIEKLQENAKAYLPDGFSGTLIVDCLFSDDPKHKLTSYIKEKGIDTVIMAARESRGLFESSFSQYVSKHTKVNIVILKHSGDESAEK